MQHNGKVKPEALVEYGKGSFELFVIAIISFAIDRMHSNIHEIC